MRKYFQVVLYHHCKKGDPQSEVLTEKQNQGFCYFTYITGTVEVTERILKV